MNLTHLQINMNGQRNCPKDSSIKNLGRKGKSTNNATAINHGIVDTSDTVYTVPDIARMFGRKECTIRKRIEKGLIPAHKMGRCWYILKSELVAGLRDT